VTRVERLAALLREREVDLLVVGAPVDVLYLTGFTGSSGLAVIAAAENGQQRFLTDFRYDTQSAEQVPPPFVREIVTIDLLEAAVRGIEPRAAHEGVGRLGFDDTATTVKQHARLRELLPTGWELAACGGLLTGLREVKDEGEVARIRAAAQLADAALREVLEQGLVGRSEREVAIELELHMRRLGAEGPSFPSIVAAGPHSALPHAEPRAQEIPHGTLLTIDWGARLEGYCSDCTRTYATGPLPDAAREVYELVGRAQAQALAAVRPGPSGREIDAVAREVIEAAGHGEHFGHGLGHGVGLEIHEAPRLGAMSTATLEPGMVVTVEPGIYVPGVGGVRIEDLVVVTATGGERLTMYPKDLITVG
jgi:Xaa-Pro aminopeptidase